MLFFQIVYRCFRLDRECCRWWAFELPEESQNAAGLYGGCVAGALPCRHYLSLIGETGFKDVEVVETKPIPLPDKVLSQSDR